MKRTHIPTLVTLAVVSIVVTYLVELAIVAAGGVSLVPPLSLPVTLVGVAVVVVVLSWPIRRAVKGSGRVDPFRSMRVAVLAKACSLSGALLVGFGGGVALFLLTRSVVGGTGPVWLAVGTVAGAAVLLAGGLLAEHYCTLPPDDDEPEEARA